MPVRASVDFDTWVRAVFDPTSLHPDPAWAENEPRFHLDAETARKHTLLFVKDAAQILARCDPGKVSMALFTWVLKQEWHPVRAPLSAWSVERREELLDAMFDLYARTIVPGKYDPEEVYRLFLPPQPGEDDNTSTLDMAKELRAYGEWRHAFLLRVQRMFEGDRDLQRCGVYIAGDNFYGPGLEDVLAPMTSKDLSHDPELDQAVHLVLKGINNWPSYSVNGVLPKPHPRYPIRPTSETTGDSLAGDFEAWDAAGRPNRAV